MLPANFNTALIAAAYLTARKAYPDSNIRLTNQGHVLNIDSTQTELPRLEVSRIHRGGYSFPIGGDGVRLKLHSNATFSPHGVDDNLQGRINEALGKTGFTATKKFTYGHSKVLHAYRHLFHQEQYEEHLDQLAQAFPQQTEYDVVLARSADITRISQIYLDTKLEGETCIKIPLWGKTRIPKSNYQRAKTLVSNTFKTLFTGVCLYSMAPPEIQATVHQAVETYNRLLLHEGMISTCNVNAVTMATMYALGDLGGQYIEGNFDNRNLDTGRLLKSTALGGMYGIECTGAYKLFKHMVNVPSRLLSSFYQSVIDAELFGAVHFNGRHMHMMEKEGPLKLSDYFVMGDIRAWKKIIKNSAFRAKAKIAAAYSTLFWLPFQTINRTFNSPEEAVGYVSIAVPPFTVFLSLISNEKRPLVEFKRVMEQYRQSG